MTLGHINDSQNDGFEKSVCQLVRKEEIENKKNLLEKANSMLRVSAIGCQKVEQNGVGKPNFYICDGYIQWKQLDEPCKDAIKKHQRLTNTPLKF